MSQDVAEPRVPDIVLERYRLNELPRAEHDRLTDRLRQDAALRGRLESLDRSDVEIHDAYRPEVFAARVREQLGARPTRRYVASWAIPAALAAAAIVLAVVVPRMGQWTGNGDRVKGLEPQLAVYRKTADGSETLADGAVAHKGDLIRLGYRAAGKSYGMILSIDGRGAVTLHLPPNGEQAAALQHESKAVVDQPEPPALLDQAYELDDAPRWERFYFVTGEAPFSVLPVMDAARRAALNPRQTPPPELALPRGLEQAMFWLQKEDPR